MVAQHSSSGIDPLAGKAGYLLIGNRKDGDGLTAIDLTGQFCLAQKTVEYSITLVPIKKLCDVKGCGRGRGRKEEEKTREECYERRRAMNGGTHINLLVYLSPFNLKTMQISSFLSFW